MRQADELTASHEGLLRALWASHLCQLRRLASDLERLYRAMWSHYVDSGASGNLLLP